MWKVLFSSLYDLISGYGSTAMRRIADKLLELQIDLENLLRFVSSYVAWHTGWVKRCRKCVSRAVALLIRAHPAWSFKVHQGPLKPWNYVGPNRLLGGWRTYPLHCTRSTRGTNKRNVVGGVRTIEPAPPVIQNSISLLNGALCSSMSFAPLCIMVRILCVHTACAFICFPSGTNRK